MNAYTILNQEFKRTFTHIIQAPAHGKGPSDGLGGIIKSILAAAERVPDGELDMDGGEGVSLAAKVVDYMKKHRSNPTWSPWASRVKQQKLVSREMVDYTGKVRPAPALPACASLPACAFFPCGLSRCLLTSFEDRGFRETLMDASFPSLAHRRCHLRERTLCPL